MPGFGIVIPRTGGSGPVLPYAIGKAGYLHRWDPNLWTENGDVPDVLEDLGSAGVDMAPNATAGLTAASATGIGRHLASTSTSRFLTPAAVPNTPGVSLVTVAKTDRLGADFFRARGLAIRRATNGQWQVAGSGGNVLGASVAGWCCVIATRAADGTTSLYVNGVETTGTITTPQVEAVAFLGSSSSGPNEIDAGVGVVYGDVLTDAEAAAIRESLKQRYPALP
ncbi:hypothetical protein [Nakamurella leprariae]|uniref:Uncharacterized protein n=1 Tax=Nakamurella leprariae TaxID=2803911 RepID=A0A938YFN4_9ACTN|nr:hypothetical protein [Nakamurella leprariae]MBM9467279.1 hypothetical protein [Nakamurella leprariae]